MDLVHEAELLRELADRHAEFLVYDGGYRLSHLSEVAAEVDALRHLFAGWRQKIYRFENDYGASVVLYGRYLSGKMTWDLVPARFFDAAPLKFRCAQAPVSNLRWSQVQALLDDIKKRY